MKLITLILTCLLLLPGCSIQSDQSSALSPRRDSSLTNQPNPTPFQTYSAPQIETKDVYIIALVGDSMTEALGPLGGPFAEKLDGLYGDQTIIVDNYSIGSTNILSVDERLTQEVKNREYTFKPLIKRDDVDLIILGSFAYNPLSDITNRQEALATQNQTLLNLVQRFQDEMPHTRVLFLSTIAPNSRLFGSVYLKLSDEDRQIQVQERRQYLENHIEFAQEHNIPVVDVYHQSLTDEDDGNLEYINPDDYIHPSAVGVEFIGQKLAEYIYQNNLLPIKE